MLLRTKLHGQMYEFPDIRILMGKANEEKSGDRLADITGGKHEYLLRPDLGRQLSDAAKQTMHAQCTPLPNIQLVVGDGVSAAAVAANVRTIYNRSKGRAENASHK